MAYHDGADFSAYDRDQDDDSATNCATEYYGAFWYKNCFKFNPNGKYSSLGSTDEENMGQTDWNTYQPAQTWTMMYKRA